MSPILGFLPDADPMSPGVLTDCSNLIPMDSGYGGAPTPAPPAGVAPLASACRGAVLAVKLDGTRRVFAGTQTRLYELTGSLWTDRSAAGLYVGGVDSRWSYCQFGDTTIASNQVDAMQQSSVASFSAIAGAPKAKIVISVANNFVVAFNTIDGTFGVQPDRWWNCAQNNQLDWTPSIVTGAVTGRLVAAEGPITAGLPLGDYAVAYKARGIFIGQFVGAASGGFQWTLVTGSAESGAVGQDAVCDIGGAHFIAGEDDFWLFDGGRPTSVGEGIRTWFRRNSSASFRFRTRVSFDRQRGLVWINFPGKASTGANDSTIVWKIGTKKWGIANYTAEAHLNFASPGVTIDGLDAYASSFDTLPDIPFDSAYWSSGGRAFSYFDAAHQLVVNSGACGPSSLTTGDVGDDDVRSDFQRLRIRFTTRPATGQAVPLSREDGGDAPIPGPVEGWNPRTGAFTFNTSGYWHRARVDMTGDHVETGYDIGILPDGV